MSDEKWPPEEVDRFALISEPDEDLARLLADSGLLFLVNRSLLHRQGLALAVGSKCVRDTDGDGDCHRCAGWLAAGAPGRMPDCRKVTELQIRRTWDPEGYTFAEGDIEDGYRKYRRAVARGMIPGGMVPTRPEDAGR